MGKRLNVTLVLLFFLLAGLVAGCGGNAAPGASTDGPPDVVSPPPVDEKNHVATVQFKKVDSMPVIDGNPNDPQWKGAYGIAGDGTTWRGIYTDDEIAILYTKEASTMDIVSLDDWYYNGKEFIQWREHLINQGETPKKRDLILNMAWETNEFGLDGGCNYMCHEDDAGVTHHVVPPGASADLWNLLTRHGYGRPSIIYVTGFPLGNLGASQSGSIDFDTSDSTYPYRVSSGTFNFISYVDERLQTSRDNPDYAGTATDTETGEYCLLCHTTKFVETLPLQGKHGKLPYRNNAVGHEDMFATAPEYIKLNPENWVDAKVITDEDIKEGRAAKIADLTKDQIEKAWSRYEELNCLIPALIVQDSSGCQAQTLYGAQWSDGVWTLEIKRSRVTNNPDDIQFDDLDKDYFMSSAGSGFGSEGIRFIFEKP